MITYCLLQRSLDPLPVKRLERAFLASGVRQPLDAPTVARVAYGMLLDDLSATAASRLASALDLEGIDVEVVRQEDVPSVSRAKLIRRAELVDEGLGWYSHLDRPRLLPWSAVEIIALGCIRRRPRHVARLRLAGAEDIETSEPEDDSTATDLVIDLVARDTFPRLRILAGEFSYACLGARMRGRMRENFHTLANELNGRVDAMPNRGAARCQLRHPEWFSYPTWTAFEEETRWLRWKIQRPLTQTGRTRARGAQSGRGPATGSSRRTPLPE